MKNEDKLHKTRHSLAHLLAAAVLGKDPDAKLGIGPVIENGFYYDIQTTSPLSEQQLPGIEKRMREMIKQNFAFEKEEISADKAKELFKSQPFKLELIDELTKDGKIIAIYKTAHPGSFHVSGSMFHGFADLCQGPHVNSAKEINPEAFKLTKVAGAYWRGSEKNPMLTRIYAVAFETRKELDDHLVILEGAKKRDHRKLGKDLDLFIFADEVGPGLPLYTEKGATIRRELERYVIDEEIKRGYRHVYTPDLARVRLYEISGHYPFYKESMYPVMD